jgi:hypothetical protein
MPEISIAKAGPCPMFSLSTAGIDETRLYGSEMKSFYSRRFNDVIQLIQRQIAAETVRSIV